MCASRSRAQEKESSKSPAKSNKIMFLLCINAAFGAGRKKKEGHRPWVAMRDDEIVGARVHKPRSYLLQR
jgi:hypothetical protein